ncbi:hypothetical protein D3C78_813260 [compost metagenome]
MPFQASRLFDTVDVEGMLHHACQRRPEQLAAGGQHQAVIDQGSLLAGVVPIGNLLAVRVDLLRHALDEIDPHRAEQIAQRRAHGVHVGLVETWANVQLRLRCEQSHGDVRTPMQVEQTHGAQRTPNPGKTAADNQDFLFHLSPPRFGRIV